MFDEWVTRDVGEVFVQLFDVTLGAHFDLHSLCVHAPTCGSALALEHNGDLYSCDHFVEPDHRLGNILENAVDFAQARVEVHADWNDDDVRSMDQVLGSHVWEPHGAA